ncbi:thioredoxin [Neisseriaceae bacterium CLB008]
MIMISTLRTANFDLGVTNVPGTHIIRFWAEWCGPCRMVAPVFEQIATEMTDKASFAEIDIDLSPEIATRFKVQSIPTLLIVKEGEEVARFVGAAGHGQITQFIQQNV